MTNPNPDRDDFERSNADVFAELASTPPELEWLKAASPELKSLLFSGCRP